MATAYKTVVPTAADTAAAHRVVALPVIRRIPAQAAAWFPA